MKEKDWEGERGKGKGERGKGKGERGKGKGERGKGKGERGKKKGEKKKTGSKDLFFFLNLSLKPSDDGDLLNYD